MNERIRELARNADLNWHNHWNDDESNSLKKFAELIVRECAHKVTLNEARNIFEYFGVEERKDLVCPKCGVDRTLVDELQIECNRLYRIIELNGILK